MSGVGFKEAGLEGRFGDADAETMLFKTNRGFRTNGMIFLWPIGWSQGSDARSCAYGKQKGKGCFKVAEAFEEENR